MTNRLIAYEQKSARVKVLSSFAFKAGICVAVPAVAAQEGQVRAHTDLRGNIVHRKYFCSRLGCLLAHCCC